MRGRGKGRASVVGLGKRYGGTPRRLQKSLLGPKHNLTKKGSQETGNLVRGFWGWGWGGGGGGGGGGLGCGGGLWGVGGGGGGVGGLLGASSIWTNVGLHKG